MDAFLFLLPRTDGLGEGRWGQAGQVPEVRISILGDLPQFFCVESLFCSLLSGRVLLVRIRRTLADERPWETYVRVGQGAFPFFTLCDFTKSVAC